MIHCPSKADSVSLSLSHLHSSAAEGHVCPLLFRHHNYSHIDNSPITFGSSRAFGERVEKTINSRTVLKAESWKFKPEWTVKNYWIWFCCSASVLGIRFRFNPISRPVPFMSYAIQLWLTNTKYRHKQIQTDLKKEGVIRPHYLCCEPGNVSVKGSKTAAFMSTTGEIWFF